MQQKSYKELKSIWEKKLAKENLQVLSSTRFISQDYKDLKDEGESLQESCESFYFNEDWENYGPYFRRNLVSVEFARKIFACWLAGVSVRDSAKYNNTSVNKIIFVIDKVFDLFSKTSYYSRLWSIEKIKDRASGPYKNLNAFSKCEVCNRKFVHYEDNATEKRCAKHKDYIYEPKPKKKPIKSKSRTKSKKNNSSRQKRKRNTNRS